MKLYIVRHGQTDANAHEIVQGWLDTELNEVGLTQAKAAANNFNEPIDVIYSSDLQRAVQTAQEFRARYKGLSYFEDSRYVNETSVMLRVRTEVNTIGMNSGL